MGLLNRGGDKKKAPKQKAEGGKKKKKRSSGGGSGMANAKKWLMLNVEKLVLGLIGLAAVFLIYQGVSVGGLSSDQSPSALSQKLQQAKAKLQPSGRDELRVKRYSEPDTFDQQATQDTQTVDPDSYAIGQPFFRPLDEQQRLREDPELLPPVEILVRSGYGPLMLKAEESGLDAFTSEGDNVRTLTDNLSAKWRSTGDGKVKPVFFTSIVGIIPIHQQLEAYNAAFIGAAEYDVDRDFPRYVGLKIERREVGTQEWVPLNVMEDILVGPSEWTVPVDSDIATKYSPDYVASVVMPIPPIAGLNMDDFVRHPKLQTETEADAEEQAKEEAVAAAEAQAELKAQMQGGSGANSNTTGVAALTEEEEAFKKLESGGAHIGMFRYFDLTVEDGKSYEYRVALLMDDPNNPNSENGTKPTQEALDPAVIVRISDGAGAVGTPRATAWTEPTTPIRVPNPGRAIVSKTVAGSTMGRSQIPALGDSGEPKARVVAIGFDQRSGYVVPVEMDVVRGMVLDTVQETSVIDPAQARIVKLEDYANSTGIMVLDIAGGKVVGKKGRDEIRSPGKILLFSPDGSVSVSDELADADEYATSIIPPEEKEIVQPAPEANPDRQRGERPGRRGRERGGRGDGGRGEGPRGGPRGEAGRAR